MQKWEYLILELDIVGSFNIGTTVHRVNGEFLKEEPRFLEYLLELGSQGWELVVLRDKSYFFFKRPVE